MSIIGKIVDRIDLSSLRFKHPHKTETKSSLLRDIANSPENFKLEALIEGDELQIKISRRCQEGEINEK